MSQMNWDEVLDQAKRDKEAYDEAMLASNYPAEYSARVDGDPWNYKDEKGVRHIVVRDMNITQRYLYRNGKIIPLREDIF